MKNAKNIISVSKKAVFGILSAGLLFSCSESGENTTAQTTKKVDATKIEVFGEETAILTAPPFVPPTVSNRKATKLKVEMEIIEGVGQMADGVEYVYWTFGGSVPGSFIRAKLGDEIEFTLKNHPDNKLPHNIDLHAVTGPGGGAASSFVAPGREITFSFKALNPGLFVYHCATAPVGMHIANGMYGLILIEPEEGLPPVDREYYVMQGDFYTEGQYGDQGLQAFDMGKAIKEDADYVVFNGRVGALLEEGALEANVGETVRLYVGNGGPNLVSSFHIIGEILDKVYVDGGTVMTENIQTTLIPAGGAIIAEFRCDVPGELLLVDHSIFRTFNKGALGMLNVIGDEQPNLFAGTIQEGIYLPEGGGIQTMPHLNPKKKEDIGEIAELTKDEKIELGKIVYGKSCFACHQANGQGIEGAFPPLAEADYLNEDVQRAIDIVLRGKMGEITVNGQKYNSAMPAQNLTDEETAAVLTYVYNSWNNNGTEVTVQMVKDVR